MSIFIDREHPCSNCGSVYWDSFEEDDADGCCDCGAIRLWTSAGTISYPSLEELKEKGVLTDEGEEPE